MADLDALPRHDAKALRLIAEASGATVEATALEIIRAYLALARGAPDALPRDPLHMTARRVTKGGR